MQEQTHLEKIIINLGIHACDDPVETAWLSTMNITLSREEGMLLHGYIRDLEAIARAAAASQDARPDGESSVSATSEAVAQLRALLAKGGWWTPAEGEESTGR